MVTEGFASSNTPQVVGGALVIAAVAVVLELLMAGLEKAASPVPTSTGTAAARPETPAATVQTAQP